MWVFNRSARHEAWTAMLALCLLSACAFEPKDPRADGPASSGGATGTKGGTDGRSAVGTDGASGSGGSATGGSGGQTGTVDSGTGGAGTMSGKDGGGADGPCGSPTDPLKDNCGKCGARCSAEAPVCSTATGTATCASGCSPSASTHCGDACVDLSTSNAHCGTCSTPCEGECTNGRCVGVWDVSKWNGTATWAP
jgi:hypothetical protein